MNAILLMNAISTRLLRACVKKTPCGLVGMAAGTVRPHRPTLTLTLTLA